ncbi:type II secretion system protein [Thalassotalea eurytherma]|uniref:MSHA biogenesis protein MshB n=1 Tax=Thalassotalea eurytherma TaxID=1144278 RepID=A0ABQ6H5C3_9GAMM|nr:type II secretion system protein [Thalassotalea eurytherma]GLX83355.1 MSHA biogenesis protein MshB [Thalassotalea eurytherma]
MRKHSGFTLIELVVVVVILGFLAVTAIPKFIDLTDQAKQANIEGMAGGFATGVSLVRAQWEAEGRPQNGSSQNSVNYDGVDLVLTSENQADGIRPGYVTGLTDGATLGGGFDAANCEEVWLNILQQPPGVTTSETTLNNDDSVSYFVSKSGTGETSLCHYHLKESLVRDGNLWQAPDSNALTTTGNSFTYAPANSAVVIHINQQ